MAPDLIREAAGVSCADGSHRPAPAEAVDFMIGFEQRYGGLWYYILGGNGMEHGLGGEATLHETESGLALRSILDGSWTARLDVLTDGRTMMSLGRGLPAVVIDRSVEQRIEGHALLAEAGLWPHRMFALSVPAGSEPELSASRDALPPLADEATGPADRWWFGGDRAVLLRLRAWSHRPKAGGDTRFTDRWSVWCFTRDAGELAGAADRFSRAFVGAAQLEEDWCTLCGRSVAAGESCLPSRAPRPIHPPGPPISRQRSDGEP